MAMRLRVVLYPRARRLAACTSELIPSSTPLEIPGGVPAQDPRPVIVDGVGEGLDGLQAGAYRPLPPPLQVGLGLLGRGVVEGLEGELPPVGLGGGKAPGAHPEPGQVGQLALRQLLLPLQPQVPGPPELGTKGGASARRT